MYHILYIDDEPGLLEIGRLFLERDGEYRVETMVSAVEALSHLNTAKYDTIVSDYMMPEMDGIIFLKTLRQNGDSTPFIIFTGKGREEVVIEALNSGADFYLQKGGDPAAQFTELAHKIRHAIRRRQADRALKQSERDYRQLIAYANEGIIVLQDSLIQMVNPKTLSLSGYSEQDLIGRSFITHVHPDDRETMLAAYNRWNAGESVPAQYSFRLLRRDGAVRWIELNAVSIVWDERPATLNFIIDITERRRAEDALRMSEERYRQFFRTTRDAVFITTTAGMFVDFNDALMELFGFFSRDEVSSVSADSLYEFAGERAAFLEHVARAGYVREHPLRFRKRDGTVFDALITMVPRKNPDGSVHEFIGTLRDITNLRRAEDALKESEERYHLFFRTTRDSVFIAVPGGRFVDCNDAMVRTLRAADREEILSMDGTTVWAHPEDRAGFFSLVHKEGYVQEHPARFRRLDGSIFNGLITCVVQRTPAGSVKAYIGSVRDLTGNRAP